MITTEEIRPTVTIEKSSGNVTYYQVLCWIEGYSTEWSQHRITTDRAEAERYIGEQVKAHIEQDKKWEQERISVQQRDKFKYLLISFDLPAKP